MCCEFLFPFHDYSGFLLVQKHEVLTREIARGTLPSPYWGLRRAWSSAVMSSTRSLPATAGRSSMRTAPCSGCTRLSGWCRLFSRCC